MEEDDDVGLMWYRARWYDPETGRFVSEDPIGFSAGDTNLNRYVSNSPVNGTDPSGLKEQDKKESVYDAVLIRVGAAGTKGKWIYDFYYYRDSRLIGIEREELKFDPSKIPGVRSFAGTYSIWLDPNGKRIKKPRVAWNRRRPKDLTSINIDDLNSLGTHSLRENFKIAAEQAAALAETYYTVSVSFLPGGGLVLLANDLAEGNWEAAATDVAVGHADKLLRVAGSTRRILAIVVDGETFRLAKQHIEALGRCPKERAKQLLDKATELWRRYKKQRKPKTFDDVLDEVLKKEAAGTGLGVVGRYLHSAHDVLANPSLLRGKTLAEVRTAIRHTPGWVEDVMRHSTTHPGGGWVFREVDSAGNFTGRLIQYHPGTRRHFGGKPYWKVSGIPNQPPVRLPAFYP